jgi:hypothetical protein
MRLYTSVFQSRTFKAFQNDLPRLKDLVSILFGDADNPIGKKARKGKLGS